MDSSAERLVWYQRGISILLKFDSVACHLDRLCAKSSGTSSSHSMLLFHNSCIISFGSRTAVVTKPSGSKMVLIKLRISLLVAGSFFSIDLIFSMSFSGCHNTPRARSIGISSRFRFMSVHFTMFVYDKDFKMSWLFDKIFVKLNPPFDNNFLFIFCC